MKEVPRGKLFGFNKGESIKVIPIQKTINKTMKVRESQIPEESRDTKVTKNKKTMVIKSSAIIGNNENQEEERRLRKMMIYFQEEGIVIPAYDLNTIEKDIRFVEKPKAHWEFGIIINKGLSQSQSVNKTDLSMWYMKEEIRDQKWERMMELLKSEGLNVIEI